MAEGNDDLDLLGLTVEDQLQAAIQDIELLKEQVKVLKDGLEEEKEKNTKLTWKVTVMEKIVAKQAQEQKRSEIEKSKNKIIVKGLSLHKEAEDGMETQKQTLEVTKQFLNLDILKQNALEEEKMSQMVNHR